MIIPKGAIIASFVYEKSSNLDGYEETDKLTLEHVKKLMDILDMKYMVMVKKISFFLTGEIRNQ